MYVSNDYLYGLLPVQQRGQDIPQIHVRVDGYEVCVLQAVELLPAQTQVHLGRVMRWVRRALSIGIQDIIYPPRGDESLDPESCTENSCPPSSATRTLDVEQ